MGSLFPDWEKKQLGHVPSVPDFFLADAGEDGGMCPIGCASIYRASTLGHYLVADITIDLNHSEKSIATLSEPVDPLSGAIYGDSGPPTRVWGGMFAPPSDRSDVSVFKSNLAKLSGKDLTAVDAALGKALSQGYDEAMYETQIAVNREEWKRTACSDQVTEMCKK